MRLRKLALGFSLLVSACAGRKSTMSYSPREERAPMPMAATSVATADPTTTTEAFVNYGKNPWVDASKDHLSTFAADVDTASYTLARRMLNEGSLPPEAAVRVEEFVNYFRYRFDAPRPGSPFSVVMDAAPSPLAPDRLVLRVGVATKAKSIEERKPARLVFLVDVSGSMSGQDRLPLAKQALHVLVDDLKETDSVSLVTYAGSTQVVLPPTGIEDKSKILAAIDSLGAGGSTAMASGLDLAYEQAVKNVQPGVISRVIVLTDGDTNVGPTNREDMFRIIQSRAKAGVTLSTIGFGMGNYKDANMEQLADKGNGNNFYIDSMAAAKKVFHDELGATLEIVAKDAKLQVDFDPSVVAKYRLVGYENRNVADEQFRDDKVDAGDIGGGHQVTAMYEIQLTPMAGGRPLGAVHIRHKAPDAENATEIAFAMGAGPAATFDAASDDFKFAFAVAAFADVLRNAPDAKTWSLEQIQGIAKAAAGTNADRAELVGLIEKARKLKGPTATVAR